MEKNCSDEASKRISLFAGRRSNYLERDTLEAHQIFEEVNALIDLLAFRIETSPTLDLAGRSEAKRIFRHLSERKYQSVDQHTTILPATIHWPSILETLGSGPDAELAPILEHLTPYFHWKHHPAYNLQNCSRQFLNNFAIVELIGPNGLCLCQEVTVGIFLIAPEVYYPLHSHDITELLYVLAGRGTWCLADGPTISLPSASAFFMPSGAAHAFWSFQTPMAAIYLCPGKIDSQIIGT